MNCDKSHGWMENKFHPQVYPQVYKKNKPKIEIDNDMMLQFTSNDKTTKRAQKFTGMHQAGSPFWPVVKDREQS